MLRVLGRLLIVAFLAAAVALGAPTAPLAAQGPDFFSNVNDMLGGRRDLFPVDDLVVTLSPPALPTYVDIAQTENGAVSAEIPYSINPAPHPFVTGVGRMFNSPRDVIVTIADDTVTIRDQDPNGATTDTFALNVSGTPYQGQFPMADFTGDGYLDFAYLIGNSVFVMSAADVGSKSAGVLYSAPGNAPFDLTGKRAALAAGDFDGNGIPEIVLAAANDNQITLQVYAVTSAYNQSQLESITLAPAGSTTFDAPKQVNHLALAAGIFNNSVNAQTTLPEASLVVMYQYDEGKHHVDLTSIQFDGAAPNLALYPVSTYKWQDSDHSFQVLSMVSAYLSFFEGTEQIVAGVTEPGNYSHLAVFTLDNNLGLSKASEDIVEEDVSFLVSVVVGNFDQDEDATQPIDLEIAVLKVDAPTIVPGHALVELYRVDAAKNYALERYERKLLNETLYDAFDLFPASLAAGDTQGRSLLLGEPTKVTANNVQPSVILSMPPMHIDYVPPFGAAQATAFNISGVPFSFFSSYQTESSSTNQSSNQGTTSFSTSLTESSTVEYSEGVPDVASASVKVKNSATQAWSNSISKTYDQFVTNSFNASSETGFDDLVWITSQRQNFYVYPIIGHYTCPPPNPPVPTPPIPLCQPADQVQLNLVLAGPDLASFASAAGSAVESYQPVHEPGNVLSYPRTLDQLKAQEPNLSLLTSDEPTEFYTDGSARTEQVQWSAGNSKNVTAGTAQNYSWSTSVSISSDVEIPEAGGAGDSNKFSFSYNGSRAFSTTNSSTTSLGESTGIGVTMPEVFPDGGLYAYGISPYIYGTNPVTGTIHSIDLGTDVQTNGILRAEFTADPTAAEAGKWWVPTYNLPDVALNHPNRWNVTEQTAGANSLNCLPIGPGTSSGDCATFYPPYTGAPNTTVWGSQFYWMKGLLLTPASANGEGPQIESATAGDQVRMQARVYNYSLADMPPDSEVIVQFYGQPFDTNTSNLTGSAFLIDTVAIAPIPGVNSPSSQGGTLPNWSTAETTALDTAAYSGQTLAFWVVVWMQQKVGGGFQLVPEMSGHGLTAIPGTLDSIPAATPLLEPYSNNIGLYTMPFYVYPQGTSPLSTANRATPATRLSVSVQPSKSRVNLNKRVDITARVHAADNDADGIGFLFYDGKPDRNRVAFEYARLPHIARGDDASVRVPFTPRRCGTHTISVMTLPDGLVGQTQVKVTINAKAVVSKLTSQIKKLTAAGRAGGGLLELLNAASQALKQGNKQAALDALHQFAERVSAQSGKGLPAKQAKQMLARADLVFDCVKP